jgi:hypothetical protein
LFAFLIVPDSAVLKDCLESKSQNTTLKKQVKTYKDQSEELNGLIESLKNNGATAQVTSQRVRGMIILRMW